MTATATHQPALLSAAGNIASADGWWLDGARRAVLTLARRGVEFSADDLRDMGVPDLDSPREQAARWGSLLAAMKAEGVIRHAGYTTSTRPSANGRCIRTWVGTATR